MSNQHKTTFRTIFDDVKGSFNGATNNVLSYFLAHLGMVVIALVLIAAVAVPIVTVLLLAGPVALESWAISFTNFGLSNPWLLIGGIYLAILPFMAVLFVVIGSIYGISKEVVETGKTTAESAFTWLRHHFLTFASAGVILSLIVLVPQGLVLATVAYLVGPVSTPLWISYASTVFVFVYSYITLGLTSMVFPAIVNGKGVQEAFFESYKLATQRFDRVFGIHTAIVLIGLLTLAPFLAFAAWALVTPSILTIAAAGVVLAGYAIVIAFFWLLFLLPTVYIAYVRVYMDLTGGVVAEVTPPTAEVPMV
ncbi:MAG: hypothetical protein ACFFED_10075 [Candidatus Thorarchaeota archaeon]